jgi:TPP-dependent pyruvate/acetoin dehydrogenase alpha subunit
MTSSHRAALGENQMFKLYADMLLIRRMEERLGRLFSDGEVPGFIHLGIGQEAVPVGVMSALTAEDTIASTHRGQPSIRQEFSLALSCDHRVLDGVSATRFLNALAEILAQPLTLLRS